jgi:glycine dehydrogenase subunit 1
VHPNYRRVVQTYADGLELRIDELPERGGRSDFNALASALDETSYAAVVVQSPNFFGVIDSAPANAVAAIRAHGALLIGVVAEALALALLQPPGEWGAEIAVGEGQSFGVAVAYGGPHVGFIATTTQQMRRIPGRLVGRTVDEEGRPAYVLTLQAREQHIRRERATSNICTNQAHCALTATIYLSALGASGLRTCATRNVERAHTLADRVCALPGFTRAFDAPVFNEFAVRVPVAVDTLLHGLAQRGILGGIPLGRWYPEHGDLLLMNATELTTDREIDELAAALSALTERVTVAV